MSLTPYSVMVGLRRLAVLGAVGATVSLTGPFRYGDLNLPFSDSVAHALLFYALTLMAFSAFPRARSAEVAVAVLMVGALSEVAQAVVGREMSLHDLVGDGVGIIIAYVPVTVQRLRELTRTHPHMTFAEIRAGDRRQGWIRSPAAILQSFAER